MSRRGNIVRSFLPREISNVRSLDIGAPNSFGKELGIEDNTIDADLNKSVTAPQGQYDFILCSEIIEHLYNPYLLLSRIKELLSPRGLCLISTPIARFGIHTSKDHVWEYRADTLKKFVEYMGFEVVRWRSFQFYDWHYALYGVRPMLRILFQRNQLLLCRQRRLP